MKPRLFNPALVMEVILWRPLASLAGSSLGLPDEIAANTAAVLDIFADRTAETFLGEDWSRRVTRDNARYLRSSHKVAVAGPHVLKLSMVAPGIVLQKIIINDHRLPESYFGPPESSVVK